MGTGIGVLAVLQVVFAAVFLNELVVCAVVGFRHRPVIWAGHPQHPGGSFLPSIRQLRTVVWKRPGCHHGSYRVNSEKCAMTLCFGMTHDARLEEVNSVNLGMNLLQSQMDALEWVGKRAVR